MTPVFRAALRVSSSAGEGIARRPLEVDVTKLYGYGFPRFRGGPMHYADQIGLDAETVVEALVNAHRIRPERYTILDSGLNRDAAARAAEATGVI